MNLQELEEQEEKMEKKKEHQRSGHAIATVQEVNGGEEEGASAIRTRHSCCARGKWRRKRETERRRAREKDPLHRHSPSHSFCNRPSCCHFKEEDVRLYVETLETVH